MLKWTNLLFLVRLRALGIAPYEYGLYVRHVTIT